LVLGPVIQKYAFGAYWTGWPFGHDLTDNKSLVAFIFWIIALVALIRNRSRRLWPVIAAFVMLVVFLIPHSVLGSELDYTKANTERSR
jgi:ABC-type transport system involved in cytochrome c biogenesis permease subunit